MRNQKSRAMWGVSIVLILCFAFFMNATSWLTKPLFPEQPKQAAAEGPSAQQTKEMLSKNVREHTITLEGEGENAKADTGLPAEPAIFKKKQGIYKPTPNPTSTSSQWWRKEGYVEEQKEKVKKERGF